MKRKTKADRLGHVQAWRGSGLSRPEYCRTHGLSYGTFMTWFKLEDSPSAGGKFVVLPQNRDSQGVITICFGNGIRVEYKGELSESLIQQLQDA